jgi:hypothetical protein
MTTKLLKKEEIDILVTYAFAIQANTVPILDRDRSTFDNPLFTFEQKKANELGEWLLEPNIKAWRRVNSDLPLRGAEPYRHTPNNSIQDAVTMLRLIGHAIFNSVLSPGWYLSDQKNFYEILLGMTVQQLDGYAEATW